MVLWFVNNVNVNFNTKGKGRKGINVYCTSVFRNKVWLKLSVKSVFWSKISSECVLLYIRKHRSFGITCVGTKCTLKVRFILLHKKKVHTKNLGCTHFMPQVAWMPQGFSPYYNLGPEVSLQTSDSCRTTEQRSNF